MATIFDNILNDIFLNALFTIDSFFFIGGFLLSYLFYKYVSTLT